MLKYVLPLLALLFMTACTSDDDSGGGEVLVPAPNFNRAGMLRTWMDDTFILRQNNTLDRLINLETDLAQIGEPSGDRNALVAARTSFDNASLAWARQSPFILAEGEALRLRELTNTYPTSTADIEAAFGRNVDFALPSNTAIQGLPALEYLMFGTGPTDESPLIVSNPNAKEYALRLVARLVSLHEAHLTALENGKEAYIANDGNSATASIDRTVNDFIFNYEKFLRAGKVGIPAGIFSDDPLADRAESLYRKNSKLLFTESLATTRDFFNQEGLRDYMDAIQGIADNDKLSPVLASRFTAIETAARALRDDFSEQVTQDNTKMLALYDELQKLTVLLKVDMLQLMGINVDYVDADGD